MPEGLTQELTVRDSLARALIEVMTPPGQMERTLDLVMQATPQGILRLAVFTGAPRAPMSATSGELWGRLGEALELLRTLDENPWSQAELGPSECVLPSAAAAEGQSYREQAAALRRSPGLNLEAGLRTDFGDEPIEDGLPGAYLGLSMEFLQSGFFENRKLGEVFRLRAEAAAVRATIDRIARTNQCRVQMSDASMVPLTRTLLEEKSAVMNELAVAYREAYLSGAVYLDEVLESEQEVARTRIELAALPVEASPMGDAGSVGFPPVVELDLEEIVRLIGADANAERLLALEEREARMSRDAGDDTRLRLYLRYGFRPDNTGQDRVSAGVIFRRPLFQSKNAGLDAELEAERRGANAQRQDRVTATRGAYDRFHNQMVRTVRQHYVYLENFERVRRSSAGWSVEPNASDLGIALGRLTDLYNSALDRAAALRELYRAGAQVFVVAQQPHDPDLFQPVALPGPDYRGREGTRALYVWSDAFNRLDNRYLMELLKAKGFQRVVLSIGRTVEPGKLAGFMSAAQDQGLEVEQALSTNAWLEPERREGVTARVAALELFGGGLHLDIEPQALEGFEENPEVLLEAYLDVVVRARVATGPSVPLSVSVPIWWPPAIYRRLDQTVDRFYLMAYGQAQAAALAERLRRSVAGIDPEKLVLVLRPSDFRSEWEMDSVYTAVSDAAGVRSGAVHDLAGYLALIEAQR